MCEKDTAGSTALAVYLREADPALSRKYLTTGAQYLKMYSQLLGPYPYEKLYVVENFWETGYGMPSFTLLGPQVIRFPFILHSSYPHEILHNWWGNGVFVDYSRGNWCEGLTAYLADHLVQEQRGAGAEYRRNSLQRYRDYVATSKDFPLAAFRERHSAATEAVGYAKAMMVFHMARRLIGDEAFRDALADFYRRYQGRRATVDQLFQCIEERSGRSFQNFLRAWWDSPGAPRLEIRNIQVVSAKPTGYRIRGTLAQTQQERLYPLEVPVLVLSDHGTIRQRVPLEGRETALDINVQSRPLALCVDPHFDLMRTLDPRETPATLSGLFGQDSVLAVLPRQATPDAIRGYRQLIEAWQSDEHRIETAWDDQLSEWPADRSVWLLGWENRWLERWSRGAPNVVWNGDAKSMRLGSEVVPVQDRVLVAVLRHPVRADRVVGWLSVDRPAAFAGVARKLPHYGKYSYLVFEGDEPTNTLKGQWPTDDSPLVVDLRGDRAEKLPEIKEASRPLAELPPAFSGNDLHAHVAWLADPAREGRGIGTAGLDAAADYISRKMAEMGLQPAGDAGTYFQTFSVTGPDGQPVVCKNVIGILPGSNPQWKEQAIILSAHYDHLGRGWPDVRSGNEGKVHPGADDNASGVAVMLEVARVLATQQPSRTLVVIAFSAEEMGRLGSRYYVEHPVRPLKETRAVINLDSVGRLKDGALQVLGTGTAEEWVHIFRGCTYVTGVPSRTIDQDVGGSDQVSFVEQGVPAVQLFTGAHGDYHRPTDTADKVDPADLVKVASFVLEAVEYLLERPEPLTVRISDHPASGASQVPRRVSFGIIPAYDYSGPGVKVESIVKDSPAERSGVRAGDVLVEWNEAKISGLREFAELLRKAEAGETVQVRLVRGKDAVVVRVRLEQRGTNSPNN
ncbi:MAG: hypothetical protein KatS3mg109_1672 [Pirellulaceae bacterium]|nr:MAG: hypothetical protein KatS3mg109_1672 [Pirellulaceae bacterium]